MHGIRGARRYLFESAVKALVLIGLKTFVGLLLDQRVAEEFMIAEEVLRGFLIIGGCPVTLVIFEVSGVGVGEIGGAAEHVVIHRRQVFIGGEIIIEILIVASIPAIAGAALVIGLIAILIVLIIAVLIVLIVAVPVVAIVAVAAVVAKITAISAIAKIIAHPIPVFRHSVPPPWFHRNGLIEYCEGSNQAGARHTGIRDLSANRPHDGCGPDPFLDHS